MVVHGSARDGEYLRNALKPESDRRNAIILMPNFGSAEYSNNYFLLGNLFDDGENPSVASQNDSTEWTYAIIEQLFIHFRAEVASKDARYDLVGFSGGGQFAHRFALFAHRPQCDRIVACSSGWYTLPDAASPFPYGLGTTQRASDADVRKALATPLHLAVGSADTDPNSSGLRHTAEADAQGLNRVQRANYAFQRAMDQSTAINAPLAWSLHIEPGVAHSAVGMGNYALTYLYP
jgi:pimeloyl-ACP methyl ester carboxylesterase